MTPQHFTEPEPTRDFLRSSFIGRVLALNIALALFYFVVITFWFPIGNPVLFALLIAGEVFHVWQAIGYCATVWRPVHEAPFDSNYHPAVDVFITVAGEPVDVVSETVKAALAMDYPDFTVAILNDGYVAKKDNWREIEEMAEGLGVSCITRQIPGGAKAGNINHGLRQTKSPLVAVFDADHVPHPDFLAKTVGYFTAKNMGFVQSPQFYKNFSYNNVTGTAWEQQELFFGPLCKGKNRFNATFMCGTNMVIRRTALAEAGGMCETNIAEDFLTSLFIHERGWSSFYVAEVLAEGLAPEDFSSYYKQQFRWTRGSLEVVFRYNPLLRRGLSWAQRWQYLYSASYFLSGIVVLINMALPLAFFFWGAVPLAISTMALAGVFLPYIFTTIYTLQRSSNYSFTFRALAFAVSAWPIQLKALAAVIVNQKTAFSVTSKRRISGNFVRLVIPHLLYITLVGAGIAVALVREGLDTSVITNAAWALLYVATSTLFIREAIPSWRLRAARPSSAERTSATVKGGARG